MRKLEKLDFYEVVSLTALFERVCMRLSVTEMVDTDFLI